MSLGKTQPTSKNVSTLTKSKKLFKSVGLGSVSGNSIAQITDDSTFLLCQIGALVTHVHGKSGSVTSHSVTVLGLLCTPNKSSSSSSDQPLCGFDFQPAEFHCSFGPTYYENWKQSSGALLPGKCLEISNNWEISTSQKFLKIPNLVTFVLDGPVMNVSEVQLDAKENRCAMQILAALNANLQCRLPSEITTAPKGTAVPPLVGVLIKHYQSTHSSRPNKYLFNSPGIEGSITVSIWGDIAGMTLGELYVIFGCVADHTNQYGLNLKATNVTSVFQGVVLAPKQHVATIATWSLEDVFEDKQVASSMEDVFTAWVDHLNERQQESESAASSQAASPKKRRNRTKGGKKPKGSPKKKPRNKRVGFAFFCIWRLLSLLTCNYYHSTPQYNAPIQQLYLFHCATANTAHNSHFRCIALALAKMIMRVPTMMIPRTLMMTKSLSLSTNPKIQVQQLPLTVVTVVGVMTVMTVMTMMTMVLAYVCWLVCFVLPDQLIHFYLLYTTATIFDRLIRQQVCLLDSGRIHFG
jgi:hypothetical protein